MTRHLQVPLPLIVATAAAGLWWITDPTTPDIARVLLFAACAAVLIVALHREVTP